MAGDREGNLSDTILRRHCDREALQPVLRFSRRIEAAEGPVQRRSACLPTVADPRSGSTLNQILQQAEICLSRAASAATNPLRSSTSLRRPFIQSCNTVVFRMPRARGGGAESGPSLDVLRTVERVESGLARGWDHPASLRLLSDRSRISHRQFIKSKDAFHAVFNVSGFPPEFRNQSQCAVGHSRQSRGLCGQRSPPSVLTTAACGGLRSKPDCRPRRALLHLSYCCAPSYSDGARDTGPLRMLD
jgi:hypothetical protein